jgi:hypothetical protein
MSIYLSICNWSFQTAIVSGQEYQQIISLNYGLNVRNLQKIAIMKILILINPPVYQYFPSTQNTYIKNSFLELEKHNLRLGYQLTGVTSVCPVGNPFYALSEVMSNTAVFNNV